MQSWENYKRRCHLGEDHDDPSLGEPDNGPPDTALIPTFHIKVSYRDYIEPQIFKPYRGHTYPADAHLWEGYTWGSTSYDWTPRQIWTPEELQG